MINAYKAAERLLDAELAKVLTGNMRGLTPGLLIEVMTLLYPAASYFQSPDAPTQALKTLASVPANDNSFETLKLQISKDLDIRSAQQTTAKSMNPHTAAIYRHKRGDFDLAAFGGHVVGLITEL